MISTTQALLIPQVCVCGVCVWRVCVTQMPSSQTDRILNQDPGTECKDYIWPLDTNRLETDCDRPLTLPLECSSNL